MSGKKIRSKGGAVSYAKWGYIFILPFFLAFAIFQLIPLASTIYYSFFEYYRSGLKIIGPNFVGLENYKSLFQSDFLQYAKNTFILWIAGFIPQIVVSLILAAWFTDQRLKIKGKQFFKVVIYMPNLIMASAFSMLFFALFSDIGPVNGFLATIGAIDLEHPVRFFASVGWTRTLIALMNFLMWFGNTTIMLMAAVMGISPSLFEAAELDGANHRQVFFKVTLPNIKPILVYVLITSLIGGLQMYDVPQILTNGSGNPNRSSMTLLMFLNSHLYSKNFGTAGALSVILFVVSAILCLIVYFSLNKEDSPATSKHSKKRKH
ncbi:MAG: sugar ABC transporter permease [Lachnospiraceae bacterium]|nr:sugar ABC transporter permease [Lachnospiraceae bacterium]